MADQKLNQLSRLKKVELSGETLHPIGHKMRTRSLHHHRRNLTCFFSYPHAHYHNALLKQGQARCIPCGLVQFLPEHTMTSDGPSPSYLTNGDIDRSIDLGRQPWPPQGAMRGEACGVLLAVLASVLPSVGKSRSPTTTNFRSLSTLADNIHESSLRRPRTASVVHIIAHC